MNWIEGQVLTVGTNRPVRFSEPFTGAYHKFRMVGFNGRVGLTWMVRDDDGKKASHHDSDECEDVRECQLVNTPSPAPDSVAIAKQIVDDPSYGSLTKAFFESYAAEQTAQRKAAGELAERCVQYNSTGSYQLSPYDVVAGALWGYARCRAGKDGGK